MQNKNLTQTGEGNAPRVIIWSGGEDITYRFEALIAQRDELLELHRELSSWRNLAKQASKDAARAYDVAAVVRHGEFARLNFPERGA